MEPSDYVGKEYNIYNPPVLERFGNPDVVRVRVEHANHFSVELSVVYPREYDGAFLMTTIEALEGQEPD